MLERQADASVLPLLPFFTGDKTKLGKKRRLDVDEELILNPCSYRVWFSGSSAVSRKMN